MYFWNIKKLKISLSKGPLSQKNTFRYLTYFLFLYTLSLYITYGTSYYAPAYLSKEVLAIILLISYLCEIFYCYKFNGGKDGEDFLGRYLSIKLLTMIRLLVFVFVITFLIHIPLIWKYLLITEDAWGSFYRDNPSALTAMFYVRYLLWKVLIPLRVILHFRDLKKLAK